MDIFQAVTVGSISSLLFQLLCQSAGLKMDLFQVVTVVFSVLASDYAGCLTSLMKFPQVSDAHYFIDKSLWLREPSVSCNDSVSSSRIVCVNVCMCM